ncbi:MAG TPA: glutathione S-transferase family protein [Polyangiaceae bacterium]|nr:glutathione S-transferase family protein [Polyangiaceae bacterium]
MKLYQTPLSTHCRPIVAFLSEIAAPYENVPIDLSKGEHKTPEFRALNPSEAVPVLEDDGFVLAESSAILKYLAEKTNSPLYPRDLKQRARVNERMDWFNTAFEHHMAFEMLYPQILPHHARPTAELTRATTEWGRERTERLLGVLDKHLLSASGFIAGDALTIADLFGASFASLPKVIGARYGAYPRVAAWLDRIESRPSWQQANGAFLGLQKALEGKPFVVFGN